jgi:hypothetical protein
MPSSAESLSFPFLNVTLTHWIRQKTWPNPVSANRRTLRVKFKTGRLSRMAVRGHCCLCKLEELRLCVAARGLRLAACGLRLAACGLRLAAIIESPAFSPAQVHSQERGSLSPVTNGQKFAGLRGVRLLHHLADSGQGFPADSQRGAIPSGIDAKTLQAFRIPQARIKKSGNQPCPRQDEQQRIPNKACTTKAMSSNERRTRSALRKP